ncbi:Rieske 2Fe-2S domain-containing protein [Trebonia sp.]|uniref:Rieske 2Fe-2S domain-containing protein n=1 Tax=Trebonia sp. TaxID=2767075 RepID=UPI002607E0AD|nr:Rieske 2Fe-2S domain-containing protein [Trebonia sp.]
MLTPEENEVLCRVGPATPMGKVLRRYWTPAFQAGDLPEPDCPPIRVTVLGENFVAFRDSAGRLGFLDELCCHRGASLVLGRVEEGGIRCLYHGWKYAADGTILETPNLATAAFRQRVKHGAYPVREAGGLGWVYLGPPGTEPPFPAFSWTDAAPDELIVSEMIMDCNWMQVQEGSIDSSHVAILHLDTLATMGAGPRSVGSLRFAGQPWDLDMQLPGRRAGAAPGGGARPGGWPSDDNAPRIEVENTPFGFHYAAIRDVTGDPGKKFVRVTAFAMPYTAFIGGVASGAVIVVPRDDYTSSSIGVFKVPKGAGGITAAQRAGGVDSAVWGPEPDDRRIRLPRQDRAAMAAGQSFAGFRGGNRVQDAAVQLSEGRLYDRAKEHLVPADLAVIRMRRLFADSVASVAAGGDPLGLGEGCDFAGIGAASQIIGADRPWQDLVPGNQGVREPARPA